MLHGARNRQLVPLVLAGPSCAGEHPFVTECRALGMPIRAYASCLGYIETVLRCQVDPRPFGGILCTPRAATPSRPIPRAFGPLQKILTSRACPVFPEKLPGNLPTSCRLVAPRAELRPNIGQNLPMLAEIRPISANVDPTLAKLAQLWHSSAEFRSTKNSVGRISAWRATFPQLSVKSHLSGTVGLYRAADVTIRSTHSVQCARREAPGLIPSVPGHPGVSVPPLAADQLWPNQTPLRSNSDPLRSTSSDRAKFSRNLTKDNPEFGQHRRVQPDSVNFGRNLPHSSETRPNLGRLLQNSVDIGQIYLEHGPHAPDWSRPGGTLSNSELVVDQTSGRSWTTTTVDIL